MSDRSGALEYFYWSKEEACPALVDRQRAVPCLPGMTTRAVLCTVMLVVHHVEEPAGMGKFTTANAFARGTNMTNLWGASICATWKKGKL
jgi:hypothetical protein